MRTWSRRTWRGAGWALLAAALSVGGCRCGYEPMAIGVEDGGGLRCGPGTRQMDGVCVPEPLDGGLLCGAGTREEMGYCVPDVADAGAGAGLRCGPGTRQMDGVCVPEPLDGSLLCGAGTHEEMGYCVPDTEDRSSACRSSDDCPEGQVCVYETGECVPPSPEVCTPRPSDGMGRNVVGLGGPCGRHYANGSRLTCAAGMVCVTHAPRVNRDTMEIVYGDTFTPFTVGSGFFSEAACRLACNPCDPGSCPDRTTCIALRDGGGFCLPVDGPQRLLGRGELCSIDYGAHVIGYCRAGLSCLPQDPFRAPGSAAVNICDDPCRRVGLVLGEDNRCHAPSGGGFGDVCNDAILGQDRMPNQGCSEGTICINYSGTFRPRSELPAGLGSENRSIYAGTCAPPEYERGVPSCSSCPAGTVCRFDAWHRRAESDPASFTRPVRSCIKPGALGYGAYCKEDSDCRDPFVCRESDPNHNDADRCNLSIPNCYRRLCLPPSSI